MSADSSPRPAFVPTPLAAYRADIGNRSALFGDNDERVLTTAILLHQASDTADAERRDHLFEALAVAIDIVGDDRIDAFVQREWRGDRCYVEALIVLAITVEAAGALNLAALVLDDILRAAPDLTELQRGRVLALRAKVEWKLGRLEEARDRYLYIGTLARKDVTGELAARAEIGLMSVAQQLGNMPEVRVHGSKAAKLAQRHAFPDLERLAHQGLAMAEAKASRYDVATASAWRVVTLSAGDETAEAEGLQILGQILLEAGHLRLARACFAAVTTKAAPARVILAALGGLALASAREGNEATVEWVMREISRARRETAARYELAEALLECATALALLGRSADADELARGAREIAESKGYHELTFRLDELAKRGVQVPAAATPAVVPDAALARDVAALEPERLPAHVRFESVPA